MHNYDVIIIGSGLGGLVCGALLSKHGYRVCVYEKNKQIGGSLQTYARNKVIFDSGVHYIGGLGEGEHLYKVFDYLGIMDKLKLKRLNMNGFDRIAFKDDHTEYKLAQGYDNFITQLLPEFPGERAALTAYIHEIQEVCSRFPLYNLRAGHYQEKESVLHTGTVDFLRSITNNERLQQVLAGNNLLYAGVSEKTPFYIHALVLNSYIQSAWKCVDGGSQIGKWLSRCITEHGGTVIRNTAVSRIVAEGNRVDHIQLADGQKITGDHFISNLHPAQTVAMTESDLLHPAFRRRMQGLGNSVAPFVLNVVLKPQSFPYLDYNYYYHGTEDAWAGTAYNTDNWPLTYAMFASVGSRQDQYADSISIMTYMRYEEMAPWKDTFNTVLDEKSRGADYEAFKTSRAEQLLDVVEQKHPGFRNCIHTYYVATPLSFRDYLGTEDGSMYGVQKDYRDPVRTMVATRTKLSNLYLTGQNLNLHGILGVTISAVLTCSELLGMEYLVDQINNKRSI